MLIKRKYHGFMWGLKKTMMGVLLLLIGSGLIMGILVIKRTYAGRDKETKQPIETYEKTLYVAKEDIPPGTVVESSMIGQKHVVSELEDRFLFQTSDIGKVSSVAIKKGCYLLNTMVMEEMMDATLREEQFDVMELSANLKENDYVDVRLVYPTGESYTVLSKVNVRNLSLEENRCFFWLTEEQRLMIHSAIVDAKLREGSRLYTVTYLHPSVQPATKVTYIPNKKVQQLLSGKPEVYDDR